MPSKRYYIAIAPISHLNGKLAPVRQKCPDTTDSEHVEVEGYWYGYKKHGTSRYGIRTMCRDLNDKPYTPAEEENRTLFTLSLITAHAHQAVPADWKLMLQDFWAQERYNTPIGYAVSECRKNKGEWPARWQG